MSTTHALDTAVHFLTEGQTEVYFSYSKEAPQVKNALKLKNYKQRRTLFGFEESGA